ncbi:MAG TPA: hypothetical protein VHB47_09125 [Thermoanaerobaculia bacterium]|nr:hypothetical protein [Thermoanaerobaculia bacterium]HXO28336.1 hypothetical protein [Thermoanaerobaculia bacterium]
MNASGSVRITRSAEDAVIEYVEPNVFTTRFRIGPEIQQMSEEEILDLFNESLRAEEAGGLALFPYLGLLVYRQQG